MTWLRLSLSEWRQRPLRTCITAAGVAIAVAALFSLLAFDRGYREGLRLELDRLGAHVLLVPKGCPYDAASMALHGANWPCYLKQDYLQETKSVPGVSVAAPVFMAAVYEKDSNQSVYLGVETNILALKTRWRIEGTFPLTNGGLLAGAEFRKRPGWQIGKQVPLPGLPGQVARVTGFLAPTHGVEDSFIYLRLADAQQRFRHTKELTHILIRLTDPDQMDQVVAQLRGCDAGLAMNVVPLAHVFHTIQSLVNSTKLLLTAVALVALFVAGTGVSNTVLMSVAERTREIGVMRALGASRGDVFRLVWLETLQVCVTGAAGGLLAAFLLAPAVETWARAQLPFVPTDSLIHWHWQVAGLCLVFAVALGTLAGFLPAWRAARLPPMLAMRQRT
jgi:putative ABC transport system permease protein